MSIRVTEVTALLGKADGGDDQRIRVGFGERQVVRWSRRNGIGHLRQAGFGKRFLCRTVLFVTWNWRSDSGVVPVLGLIDRLHDLVEHC